MNYQEIQDLWCRLVEPVRPTSHCNCLHNNPVESATGHCCLHNNTVHYATDPSRDVFVQEGYSGEPVIDLRPGPANASATHPEVLSQGQGTYAETYGRTTSRNKHVNGCSNQTCYSSPCLHHYSCNWSPSCRSLPASMEIKNESRIHQKDRVPHVPKINSRIPSEDEATSDHQRLLHRLELYDLEEVKVPGDGNCQFSSISDQLYRIPEYHGAVRQEVIDQLKAFPEFYAPYVPLSYDEYLRKMSKVGEWGDHVTLKAAADSYGIRIFVLTSYRDTCYIEILPRIQKSQRVIVLSFWAEVHYNSIYAKTGGRTSVDLRARKEKEFGGISEKSSLLLTSIAVRQLY